MTSERQGSLVFLSHKWGPSCPAYGNGPKIQLNSDKCIDHGDSCNTITFSASNHIGTHFDFPLHFDKKGKSIDEFSAEFFVHEKICIAWLKGPHLDLVSDEVIENSNLIGDPTNASLLLIRTGASLIRGKEAYWKNGPGLDVGLARYLRKKFPHLNTVGIDSISITSFSQRELGRKVHKEFLCESPIVLIEDMNLEPLENSVAKSVIALPLRIENADGAPCTVIATIEGQ